MLDIDFLHEWTVVTLTHFQFFGNNVTFKVLFEVYMEY